MESSPAVKALLQRGVVMPCPAAVEVGDDVHPERIAPGVVLHAGSAVRGAETAIGAGSVIGGEAPATVEDCQLGKKVALKGGYFSGATFLDGANMGSAAHVRPGTLLEEEAGGAHAVGLKQTIFLPYVTAGSLINFCDALMAGGTSRKNHSEIGSSYIHFNFTPHQDKATPSLIGDVPRGVMLDRPAIFLGGQGGLVGPVRIAFGTVIPAGQICRRDILEENRLYAGAPAAGDGGLRPYSAQLYRSVARVVRNNLVYIGNIWALRRWYEQVRKPWMTGDPIAQACYEGAVARLDEVLEERVKRLGDLAGRMAKSLELAKKESLPEPVLARQRELMERWPEMEAVLKRGPGEGTGAADRDGFLQAWSAADRGAGYLKAIAALPENARRAGSAWLQALVDELSALWKD
ncbi:MAG TPA: UDP-N-acetylglucosamine pyrophosphorylase [Kiritimatiellia bacterium]|nr:UDP-N-acetylglucosamine pyrophosphorylase [Kiritimatiellia bacterium]HRZ13287.1 UDP-N-acetylglucosamine pyrophosphorylase [Kiritimatiellia bacterium]HSA18736.1 UDP-N-acetylglucosamine pyrophosphorylase [Kiritimatiellia bacterium]